MRIVIKHLFSGKVEMIKAMEVQEIRVTPSKHNVLISTNGNGFNLKPDYNIAEVVGVVEEAIVNNKVILLTNDSFMGSSGYTVEVK